MHSLVYGSHCISSHGITHKVSKLIFWSCSIWVWSKMTLYILKDKNETLFLKFCQRIFMFSSIFLNDLICQVEKYIVYLSLFSLQITHNLFPNEEHTRTRRNLKKNFFSMSRQFICLEWMQSLSDCPSWLKSSIKAKCSTPSLCFCSIYYIWHTETFASIRVNSIFSVVHSESFCEKQCVSVVFIIPDLVGFS